VIVNLALWLALHTLFAQMRPVGFLNLPVPGSVNWTAVAIALAAMVAIFRFRIGIIPVLAGSCLAGIALHLIQLA